MASPPPLASQAAPLTPPAASPTPPAASPTPPAASPTPPAASLTPPPKAFSPAGMQRQGSSLEVGVLPCYHPAPLLPPCTLNTTPPPLARVFTTGSAPGYPGPTPRASLMSRHSTPFLSTCRAAGGHPDPSQPEEDPLVGFRSDPTPLSPGPALPAAPAREHDAPPHRPRAPRELHGPGRGSRPHGQWGAHACRERVQELPQVRHPRPRICTRPVLRLWSRGAVH